MNEHPAEAVWHVDDRCTNCDVARQLAPDLVAEVDGRSSVVRQPRTDAEEDALYAAAFACHTRSIRRGARGPDPALDPFPLRLSEHVHLCGHNSRHTAGANSYLLRRPAGNLMMIDTPRWSSALAAKYAALGPITDVLLTHRDHAAHGREYADRFGARLWIHEGDLAAAPDADGVLRGAEPIGIADGVTAHPLPGHTEGSVLYLADETYCFSGDSFYWSRHRRRHRRRRVGHLVLHHGTGRVAGPYGTAGAFRMAAARPRRPQAAACRRVRPPDARPGPPRRAALTPADRLHRPALVTRPSPHRAVRRRQPRRQAPACHT